MKPRHLWLLALIALKVGATGVSFAQQGHPSVTQRVVNENRLEDLRSPLLDGTNLLVPYSFQQSGRMWTNTDSSIVKARNIAFIPAQFRKIHEISAQQQQWLLREQADEALYRRQSEPGYFEKSGELFRQEFKKRLVERNDP